MPLSLGIKPLVQAVTGSHHDHLAGLRIRVGQEIVLGNITLTGFYQKLKSFWACSHMNCCLQNILHINLHILHAETS